MSTSSDPPAYILPAYVPAEYLVTGSPLTAAQLTSRFHDFRDSLRYVSTAPELVFERLVANLNEAYSAGLDLERQQYATALQTLQLSNEQLQRELAELKSVAQGAQGPEKTLTALSPPSSNSGGGFYSLFRAPGLMSFYSSPKFLSDLAAPNTAEKEESKGKGKIKLLKNPAIGKFHTNEVRSWKEPRVETWKLISFATKYSEPPGLPVGLTDVDIGSCDNPRVRSYANNIRADRCDIHLDTWEGTKLYGAGCTWLEIEADDSDFQFGSYNTVEDHPWYRPSTQNSRKITFQRKYPSPPAVVVFLSALDMKRGKNWRLKAFATDITPTGFTIHIDTWDDSVLYSGTASWVAYPASREDICSGTFATTEFRTWKNPQLNNSRYMRFDNGVFDAPPRVMLALSWLDIDHRHNMRLQVKGSDISTSGMTWHLNGWEDTTLYGAGGSYIALS